MFVENDISFYIGVYRSKSGEYIIVWNGSTLVSDYHILRADDPDGDLVNFSPRRTEHEYSIEHYQDKFYILTNWNAKNNRLMEVPENVTDITNWKEIISDPDVDAISITAPNFMHLEMARAASEAGKHIF